MPRPNPGPSQPSAKPVNPQRRKALQADSDSGNASGTGSRSKPSRLEERVERLKQATRARETQSAVMAFQHRSQPPSDEELLRFSQDWASRKEELSTSQFTGYLRQAIENAQKEDDALQQARAKREQQLAAARTTLKDALAGMPATSSTIAQTIPIAREAFTRAFLIERKKRIAAVIAGLRSGYQPARSKNRTGAELAAFQKMHELRFRATLLTTALGSDPVLALDQTCGLDRAISSLAWIKLEPGASSDSELSAAANEILSRFDSLDALK